MAISVATGLAYAEELDVRFLPSKMVENSHGIMHVFVTDGDQVVPKMVTDLTVTSLDSTILHIEKASSTNSFITEVSVKAVKAGTTKIYLAAPGFTSKEIPVTVYGNKNNAAKILLKVTPNTFTTSGSNEGYVSVELADEDGFPVIAKEDVTILLSTANKDVLEFADSSLIIKKGQYYAYSKFFVKKSGNAIMYATSNGIETQSATITIKKDEDIKVKMYTYPKILSTNDASKGFIIAQLQDSSGRPVLAQKDITVHYKVIDSTYSETSNYSNNYKQKNTGYFTIPKGSYWGYTQYSLPKGIEGTYDVSISTQDPLTVETEEIEAKNLQFMDDKTVKFETIPVLTTGNNELIGAVYLEDESGNPIGAKKDLMIRIDSSDASSLTIKDTIITRGDQVALVFGKTSHSAPTELKLRPVVAGGELTTLDVFGPNKDSLQLVVEPLISKVLSGTDFPFVFYLKDGNEITAFPESKNIFISPNEYVTLKPKTVLPRDTLVVAEASSLKKGATSLSFEIGDFKSSLSVDSMSLEPASARLDRAKTVFVGTNDVFSIQLLNAAGLPTYATDNVDVSIVTKDQGIIEMPSKITIEKGKYYTLFDAAPKSAGETDVSLLAKGLPLFTEKVKVVSLKPTITVNGPQSVNASESFMVTISAAANGKPLADMNVGWDISGGIVQISDSKTGSTGEAMAAIIAQDSPINIKATVGSQWYPDTTVSKTVAVNRESGELFVQQENIEQQYQTPEILGIDPVLLVVPVAIVASGFMLKKKGQLKIRK
ncbi:conserved hypothetical protein [Candidatus Nitrosotenuis uzonensis]|uniref:Uncharacterized protein n=2 Tax=Candidatus Nitrosotenuis uzonensis TaxID=1407055 RepID=A0A812EVN8_9ARCH|nr:conserved hypothetical protein [Candidatus Nitrosotenuis uzonensis]